MKSKLSKLLALIGGLGFSATLANAHAELQQATPAVGGTVKGSPRQLTLRFTEGVEARFSSVGLAAAGAGAIPVEKVSVGGPDATVVTVTIGRALGPGSYVVTWRITSVDSHKTHGTYRFTVAP